MGLTLRLTARIQEALGPEAAEDLMNWIRSIDDRQDDLREIHELTTTRFEARLDQAKAELRGDMQTGFASMRADMAHLEIRFERRFQELLKWSFVFWSTTLLTLLGVLIALR